VAPADLQTTQTKRAMHVCNGLPQNGRLQKLVSQQSLGFGKNVKKGRSADIRDQGAEETGKEIATNCWNSLL